MDQTTETKRELKVVVSDTGPLLHLAEADALSLLKYLGEIVQAQANTFGFQDGFIAITIVSLVAIIPTSLLLLHRR